MRNMVTLWNYVVKYFMYLAQLTTHGLLAIRVSAGEKMRKMH